jgi:hypothetical protein
VQRMVLALALLLVWTTGIAGTAARPLEPIAPAAAVDEAGAELPQNSTCDLIERSAAANGLPIGYFTRLIWRESSFRAGVVSPVGAQGIAQFMPGTAAERGLVDPFDPLQAIPASAQLLKALAERFGNLGLAAAAYNSGPRRVADWLAGAGGLPRETRDYVAAITGRTVEDWRALADTNEPAGEGPEDAPRQEVEAEQEIEPTTCLEVLAALDAPPLTDAELQAPQDQAEWQPWGVQLAGNFSEARAVATYRNLQQRYPAVLGDRAPLILRKRNPGQGSRPMVNVRVPVPTREAANELCRRLREAGGACVVLRN